jgi:hypothetical protein
MRRALRARDDGCRFPGCTNRFYIDGHHIEHWANGGETSLANRVQLCRYHHHLRAQLEGRRHDGLEPGSGALVIV